MDADFFRTRYFVIPAIVAVMIVGGAAGAYFVGNVSGTVWTGTDACDAPALGGTALGVTPAVASEDRGERRTETYTLNASRMNGGALELCVSVGEIIVEPASGGDVEVEVVIRADHASAVDATVVEASFHDQGGRLVMAVWQSVRGESTGMFGTDNADVRIILRVPATGSYAVKATAHIGDIHVSDLIVDDFDATTDIGDIVVVRADFQKGARFTSSNGDILVEANSVQAGTLELEANIGDADVTLPRRADVGYDVTASADIGEVAISIGDTEAYTSDARTTGETESARTAGYGNKPTKVVVRATTHIGDASVRSE